MMCTYLQRVTATQLAELVGKPESIAKLDEPETFSTYSMATINYFLTGSAYPGRKRGPLALALMGVRNVPCRVLENGSFERVAAIASALQAVDVEAIEAAVAGADLEALAEEEEIDELVDVSAEEAAADIASDVRGLVEFYAGVAASGAGVVIYTT